jgi:hypothetical protein
VKKKRIAWDANRVPKEQGHRGDAYDLITRDNIKLGSDVWKFSLPVSAEACPGATPWCRQFCYAKEGWYIRKLIQNIRDQNWTAAQAGDFVQRLQRDIHHANPNLFRIHDSGDFFSVSYIEAWERVIEAFPAVHFWAFTHSWRVPELLPALEQLRQRPIKFYFATENFHIARAS